MLTTNQRDLVALMMTKDWIRNIDGLTTDEIITHYERMRIIVENCDAVRSEVEDALGERE